MQRKLFQRANHEEHHSINVVLGAFFLLPAVVSMSSELVWVRRAVSPLPLAVPSTPALMAQRRVAEGRAVVDRAVQHGVVRLQIPLPRLKAVEESGETTFDAGVVFFRAAGRDG